ncbi:hypothetical protein Fuma_00021 [Fuerstiella marisgermanici]|uniref:Uncharacterized protein n=1 Tax=Fuerstiella marisgermanici TaxID=1891926 RepID=A0A1P8W8T3_9PLAN|nr:hypothetical protein Fuma_00021 [Fuerstiella marisgermanici]
MCGKVAPPRTKAHRVTVASRPKEYRGSVEVAPRRRFGRFREAPKQRDRGGRGHEIVKEMSVCSMCAEAHRDKQLAIEEAAKAAAAQAAVEESDDSYGDDDE